MTFILGSRCFDGVVIIADTKFTTSNGPTIYSYNHGKTTGEFSGYLTAFSGDRHKFERFRSEIREFRSTMPYQISIDRMLIGMSEIMERINTSSDGFELLVGISGAYFPDRKSMLKHFYTHGGYVPVNTYKVIGSEPFGKIYLRYWHPNMTMKEVAELGYYIIKYIQYFNLDESVGVDEDYPVEITFIPDNPTDNKLDYLADNQMLTEFEERINTRLKRIKDETFQLVIFLLAF